MQINVDIPEADLNQIDRIAAAQHRARDAVIQDAVAAYVANHWASVLHDAFGLWGNQEIDGLEFQRRLRSEWDERGRKLPSADRRRS